MTPTKRKINWFLMLKLPAAFLCGVRVKSLTDLVCVTTVRHRWINQNPFRSMYFAVQSMAGELSTGALVFSQIAKTGAAVSMLVTSSKAVYLKKATGLLEFRCDDGQLLAETISRAVATSEAQTIVLKSIGRNAAGEIVSEMEFEWSIRAKSSLNLP